MVGIAARAEGEGRLRRRSPSIRIGMRAEDVCRHVLHCKVPNFDATLCPLGDICATASSIEGTAIFPSPHSATAVAGLPNIAIISRANASHVVGPWGSLHRAVLRCVEGHLVGRVLVNGLNDVNLAAIGPTLCPSKYHVLWVSWGKTQG